MNRRSLVEDEWGLGESRRSGGRTQPHMSNLSPIQCGVSNNWEESGVNDLV